MTILEAKPFALVGSALGLALGCWNLVAFWLNPLDDSMVGRIILPDESGRCPSTLADDSYADSLKVIDPDSRRKALDEHAEFRYFSRESLQSRLMQAAGVPTRVFDKGNEKVSGLIRSLRQEVHDRIEETEYVLIPEGVGILEEMDSKISIE